MLRELINTAEQRTLLLTQIRRDGGTQPREGIDWEHVKDLQDAIADGAVIPAVSVIYDGAAYWLWDGFHRWHAYNNSGRLDIPVTISQGTQDDAQWQSYAANRSHGLKRTAADKERAIRTALKHPKSAGLSNMAIGRHLGVSDKTVAKYREDMELTSEIPKSDLRQGADGRTINTANIGANRPAQPAPVRAEMFQIEAAVREAAAAQRATAADLRTIAKQRIGRVWQECLKNLPAGTPYRDLAQGLNNVADQMEQAARRQPPAPAAPPAAAAEPVITGGDPWAVAWEERRFDKLTARCERLAEAMLPWAAAWTDDKGRTWREVAERNPQHANSPFRQDVVSECDRRGLKVFEEALALTIRNLFGRLLATDGGQRPLPEWTQPLLPEWTQPLPPESGVERSTLVKVDRTGMLSRAAQEAGYTAWATYQDDKEYGAGVVAPGGSRSMGGPFAGWRQLADWAESDMRLYQAAVPAPATVVADEPQPEPDEWYAPSGAELITIANSYPLESEPVAAAGAPQPAIPVSQRADYESDEWYTPAEYIEAARAVMGVIDLDPASSDLAQTVVRADGYLTKDDDGLKCEWFGTTIWLNPPYSSPAPWVEKLLAEFGRGRIQHAIILVNNATETNWFQMLLERYPVCLPAKRLAFWRHDQSGMTARQGQAVFYLGPNIARFQKVFSQFGPILRRLA